MTVLFTACANLAPLTDLPSPPVAEQWPVGNDITTPAPDAPAPADLDWRVFVADAKLRELITLALGANRDLRATALAVESAIASRQLASAARLPTLTASTSQTITGGGGDTATTRRSALQLGISAFELDFFGRLRNVDEQARQNLLATEESLRATRIALVAEVAAAYLTLAADQQRLALAERTLDSQQTTLSLTRRTFEAGVASGLDVAQVQTSVDTARVEASTYRTLVSQDLNALVLLVGRPLPTALIPDAADNVLDQAARWRAPRADLPSQVLLRRPDVRAAEHDLRAANASIGAARARLFPTISLTSTLGLASTSLTSLFDAASGVWTFVPALALPIFDGGTVRASIRASEIQRDAVIVAYEKAIQSAFRDVADALAQRRDMTELVSARQSLVTATDKAFRLSDARFRSGIDSYLTTLDAQRSTYSAQQGLITARLAQASNLVTLYRVLGGGWQPLEAQPAR